MISVYFEDTQYQAIDINKKYNFSIDYIKLDVFALMNDNQPSTARYFNSIIALGQVNDKQFTLGRVNEEDCDINIGEFVTLSRKHAKLNYKKDENGKSHWWVVDGSEDAPSRNGTWKSLNKRGDQKNRMESKPYEIKGIEFFRVGNTQLKIEIERNNNSTKKKNNLRNQMEIESPR